MGNCFGGLCGEDKNSEAYRQLQEQDKREAAEARARSAAAAEQRQTTFDKSATGRAANKAALEARKTNTRATGDEQVVRDWNS
eukprot:CAMPEP_0198199756 /NCGR_PEP_ID=MMETSP1445-20131203/2933_1 /TAXON_ID=36898 /ORGANISM="Pyramimonas sp., Strain CCMP2087" /LENGTH=82 /DNA_ID=CAMNT_0043869647 /DNA_START=207 /DNA_END=455 /DNA_ORIENTATION=+